jgi:hypothetical protein
MIKKGALVCPKPYLVRPSGTRGMVVTLNPSTLFRAGDRLYQVRLTDGSVLLTRERPPGLPEETK